MREAQLRYFRQRNSTNLVHAKTLERQVDNELEDDLFDDDDDPPHGQGIWEPWRRVRNHPNIYC